MSTRYSQVVAREPAKPTKDDAVLPILDAQARCIEAHEAILRTTDHDEIDNLMAEAMRKLATARSANRELQRHVLGLVTIASTG